MHLTSTRKKSLLGKGGAAVPAAPFVDVVGRRPYPMSRTWSRWT